MRELKKRWTPFKPASLDENEVRMSLFKVGIPAQQIEEHMKEVMDCKVYLNSLYQVAVYVQETDAGSDGYHLSIKRLDGSTVRDWRDLQRIKNEIIGPEYEACELFPAESRMVDLVNQFHLWVLPRGLSFPFGFGDRSVDYKNARGVGTQRNRK